MKYLIIVLSVLLYIILGFISFIWNAKRKYATEFDSEAMRELLCMISTGPLSFIILVCMFIHEKFYEVMNKLLKRINK